MKLKNDTSTPKKDLAPMNKPRSAKTKKIIPIPKLIEKAQVICNAYIRKRDEGKPCISCGKYTTLYAGHYFSRGHYTALRFDEANIHGQCDHCNRWLSGNLINYRKGLVKRYGGAYVEKLEMSAELHKAHKWNRLELEAIIQDYKEKIKK